VHSLLPLFTILICGLYCYGVFEYTWEFDVANALNDYLILLIRLIGVEISLVRLNANKMCFTI
jgi:hypothetical protein